MDHVLLMKVTSIMCIVEAVQRKKKALNRLQKKRSVWVKPWIERRQLHHGAYYDLLKELEAEDIKRDKYFPHMDKSSFDDILEKITPLIKREDTHMRKAISPEERLALTLRFLTSGNTYQDIECLYRVPRSTLSKLIPETCKAIYDVLKEDYLKVPQTEEDWLKVAEGFKEKWQFPNCIGALDGQIIQINPRPGWVSMYKNNVSIIQMALVDADYKFIYVDVGCRVDDGGVWHGCSLKKALDDGTINIPGPQCLPGREKPVPHVIVADKVFPLKETIMKPYPSRGISKEKEIFNYRLSRARRTAENAFGIQANRFRVFQQPFRAHPNNVRSMVLSTCVLHNYLLTRPSSRNIYTLNNLDVENIKTGIVTEGSWRRGPTPNGIAPLESQCGNRAGGPAKLVQNEFCDYFNGNGKVEWQWRVGLE